MLASLSLLSLVLTGCGTNTDPGSSITIQNDSIKNRRNLSEDFAKIREAEDRAKQQARERQFKSDEFTGNSTNKSKTENSSRQSSVGSSGSTWSRIASQMGGLQGLATIGLLAAIFKGDELFRGGEKKEKKSEKTEEQKTEKQSVFNKNQAKVIQSVQENASAEMAEIHNILTKEDPLCFFGPQVYQIIIDIFNAAAPGREV